MKVKRQSKSTMASRAQLHELYEKAVQSPEADVEFITETYEKLRGRAPISLREDFCGTAKMATTWCLSDPSRTAVGVDIDAPTLAWGRENNLAPNQKALGDRVQLKEGDVRHTECAPADVACAMNFSFCVFKTRPELLSYLRQVKQSLKADGMVFLELYGGTEAIIEFEEEREVDDHLTYCWDQDSYDPITHETTCLIHFSFSDGSELRSAFRYDWRLWTVPELRELLIEAGFAQVKVFWESVEDEEDGEEDEDGEIVMDGTGEYEEITGPVENQESWLVYVVGLASPA